MGTRTIGRGRPVRARSPWYDSPWRIVGHAISTALALVMVAIVCALFVVPRLSGGASLTVLTGSMEPALSPGDVIVVRGADPTDVCSAVDIGQIVTFYPEPNDPTLISHRVVGKTIGTFDDGTSCRLITQGDANSAVDEPVSPQQVRGTFLFGVPQLGWVRQWAADNLQVLVVAGAVLLIGAGIASSMRRPRTRVYVPPGHDPSDRQPAGNGGVAEQVHDISTVPAALDPGDRAHDRALRERDLELRERELALRERELDLARRQAGMEPLTGTPGLPTAPVVTLVPRPETSPSDRIEA